MANSVSSTELNSWLEGVLRPFGPAERRTMFREIVADLYRSQSSRIQAQQNPDGTHFEARRPRRGNKTIRERAMFSRLRNRKNLKSTSDANHAAVGFTGRTARIAEIHQGGLLAEVEPGGPLVRYARRELLGFTREDLSRIESTIASRLAGR